jgi:Flp pilus assembly pilin Flp
MNKNQTFLGNDLGLSTVEYVIILVLIAAAAVGTWSTFGQLIQGKVKASIGEMRDMK